jgi:hypothetical protein
MLHFIEHLSLWILLFGTTTLRQNYLQIKRTFSNVIQVKIDSIPCMCSGFEESIFYHGRTHN